MGDRALLADFGIARVGGARAAGTGEPTTAGMILGTISYMSPEQASGEPDIDGRSDLYSLGCVLYELLTGSPPFVGSPMAVLGQHLTAAPRRLRNHDIRVSPAIDELATRLLTKEASQRPATAAEVARALRAAQQPWEAPRSPSAGGEADRLVAEGTSAYRFGSTGGPSARSHLDQAGVYFRRALAIAPQHPRALALLGNWHFVMGNAGYLPRQVAHAKGRELILAALASDDQVADVHASLGKVALYYDDDCHAAGRHVQRAVALDPEDAEVLRFQCIVLKIQGRVDEAVGVARTAVALAPEMPFLLNALGDVLLAAGRNAEAAGALRRAIGLQPGYVPALERLELAQVRLGEVGLALEVRASRLRMAGEGDRAELLAREADEAGPAEARRRDLHRELEGLLALAAGGDPFSEGHTSRTIADRIVGLYVELGEWSSAMDWVERSHAQRPGRLRRLLTDVLFDRHGLRADPRYARLLRVAGMEDLI